MIPRTYAHWLMPTTNAYDHFCKMNLCRSQSSGVYYQVGIKPKDRGKYDRERQKGESDTAEKGRYNLLQVLKSTAATRTSWSHTEWAKTRENCLQGPRREHRVGISLNIYLWFPEFPVTFFSLVFFNLKSYLWQVLKEVTTVLVL